MTKKKETLLQKRIRYRREEHNNWTFKYDFIYDEIVDDLSKMETSEQAKLDDWKIYIPSIKKKFSILKAEPNGKDIFERDWVYYFTGIAAKRECKKQGLKLLENKEQVEEFIGTFEWGTEQEKLMDFVNVFWLTKAGYWNPYLKGWINVGSVGCVRLSRVDDDGHVCGARWNGDIALIERNEQECPSPFVACEDCFEKNEPKEKKRIEKIKFNWDMPSDSVISKINEIADYINDHFT